MVKKEGKYLHSLSNLASNSPNSEPVKEMTYKGALKLLIGEEKTIYEWFYK